MDTIIIKLVGISEGDLLYQRERLEKAIDVSRIPNGYQSWFDNILPPEEPENILNSTEGKAE